MNVLKRLNRRLRRFNRAAEGTALGAAVIQTPGAGGAQPNAMGVKAVLGEIEEAVRVTESGEIEEAVRVTESGEPDAPPE